MNLLKQLRERKQWTTYEVARRISMPQSGYYRIESGDASATPESAASIASLFEVPVDLIFTPSRYVAATLDAKAS